MMKFPALLVVVLLVHPVSAAEPKPLRGLDMDYGPVLSYSVLKPGSPAKRAEKTKKGEVSTSYPWTPDELIAARGVTVKVGTDASLCFDADTMRYAAGWTGGWLDLTKSHLSSEKGSLPLIAKGSLAFTSRDGPGFAEADLFDDPRRSHVGPLPKDWSHFSGIYRDGQTVVLAYTVGRTRVLDQPGLITTGPHPVFSRTIRLEPSTSPTKIYICDAKGDTANASGGSVMLSLRQGEEALCLGLLHSPPGTVLTADGNSAIATIPPLAQPAQFTIAIARWSAGDAGKFAAAVLQNAEPADLTTHTHGGVGLWKEPIETAGKAGPDNDAYTLDSIGLPEKNPWHAWIRPTALDFFPDGRCAVCTWNGDVWIASNLSAIDHVKWKRFASGLYDPLGLKILNGEVYVLARDGIVRLHDLNGDGEADFYENFNNDRPINAHYNSFAMDLVTDSAGSFYYAVAGTQQLPADTFHNDIVRVSSDGSYLEEVATGLRTANGLGIGPHDELTVSDNQGNWVPASPIYLVKPGAFYHFAGDPHRYTKPQMDDVLRAHPKSEEPICWVPYAWDTSSGGQVWAGEKWGPLSGHLLHTSYGKSALFEVMTEQVDGVWQGGAVQLPLHFDSGIQRARVNPVDGQVWVCGLHGWQTSGAKDGCLDRIRYTGKPCYLPTGIHASQKGFTITFATELGAETAADPGSYGIEEWLYHTTEAYGSDDYKVSSPSTKGRDAIEVKKAVLSADKRSVTLEVDGMKPVQQYVIKMNLKAGDGGVIKCQVGGTINEVAH